MAMSFVSPPIPNGFQMLVKGKNTYYREKKWANIEMKDLQTSGRTTEQSNLTSVSRAEQLDAPLTRMPAEPEVWKQENDNDNSI